MQTRSEPGVEAGANLTSQFNEFREKYSELPAVLSSLSVIQRLLSSTRKSSLEQWLNLKKRGFQLARKRALFIAAEATGHLPLNKSSKEVERIREDLTAVISEGNSLHKVRALRAMRFIASEECITALEQGLVDPSAWVQATALHSLFRLNFRRRQPRRVFLIFLLSTFRHSLGFKALFSARAFLRNFSLNKGLFVGLLKEPGGMPLAALSLILWIITCTLGLVIPIVAIPVGFLVVVASTVYGIVDAPFWFRRIPNSDISSPRRIYPFVLLDYAFVLTYAVVALPFGLKHVIASLFVFGFLHLIASAFNRYSFELGESLRTLNRGFFTLVLAVNVVRFALSDRWVVYVLFIVAPIQLVWSLPQILRAISAKKEQFARATAILVGFLRKTGPAGFLQLRSWFKRAGKELWRHPRWLVAVGILGGFGLLARFAPASAVPVVFGPVWQTIEGELSDAFVLLRPYLYLTIGILLLLIYCAGSFSLIHLLWDEAAILARVRFRALASRPSHFTSLNEFVNYVFMAVRNEATPVGMRVRAVFALAQVPISNVTGINQLMDLAEGELPTRVRDAVYQVIDAAESRFQRGQRSTVNFDMEIVNKEIRPLLSPSSILRGNIFLIIGSILLVTLASGVFQLHDLNVMSEVDLIALIELSIAFVLVIYYCSASKRVSSRAKRSLVVGMGLLSVALIHPLQPVLINWPNHGVLQKVISNLGVTVIDFRTLAGVLVPVILFGIFAQFGHLLYLLDNDVSIEPAKADSTDKATNDAQPKSHDIRIFRYLQLRKQRLAVQPGIVFQVLFIGLAASIFQSQPLQELLDLRNQSMPAFVQGDTGSQMKLTRIPLDGRVIRVALVPVVDDQKTPWVGNTFPIIVEVDDDGRWSRREVNRIYRRDRYCWGEVWISASKGTLQAWQTLPHGCLEFPVIDGDTATFDFRAHCVYHGSSVRLLATVYDRARSESVALETEPANVLHEVAISSQSSDPLLSGTLSPFVRSIWSSPFREAMSPDSIPDK